MKSNLTKKDYQIGQNIIDILQQKDIRLSPNQLKDIISDYQKFSLTLQKYGLWQSQKTNSKKFKQKYSKIMLLFSGITASGKDAIKEEIENLAPNLFKKTVTGTSRPPREGEIEGKDYFFFKDNKTFKQSLKKNEFIEFYKRENTYYGLPKKSLDQIKNNSSPVIYSQVEISGWSKIEKYLNTITQNEIFTLKIFVLPDMNFSEYQNWLSQKRPIEEIPSRLAKTGWELKKAPKKADFIVTNRIREDKKYLNLVAKTIINQISEVLDFPKFPNFPSEFTIDKKLKKSKDIEKILSFHDSI